MSEARRNEAETTAPNETEHTDTPSGAMSAAATGTRRRATCAPRRRTCQVKVGAVTIGGDAPVRVQSMTCTRTGDADATLQQIRELATAGAEIVRVTVNDEAAAEALPRIVAEAGLPLVADIHFDYRMALRALDAGISKLRINPGNIGSRDRIREVARAAADRGVPIRIGVNRGSLHRRYRDQHLIDPAGALVQSALDELETLAGVGFTDVVVSLKSSEPREVVEACRRFAEIRDVPQHLGVTEAGTLHAGAVRSTAAMSVLLAEGIGDTLRISLAADPVEEVRAAFHMLQALGLREGYARVVACPTCGRVEVDVMQLAARVEELARDLPPERVISVMGCVVNGPGEAKAADLGIAAGKSKVAIFRGGKLHRNIDKSELEAVLLAEIERLR
jgi:(E)-4-hydroxy-3-methylbut-2-enyl-diphosphate synthase